MAFVAEDGTGLETANSAVTVAFADAYFTDRGVEGWTDLDTAEKEVALIKGTDYAETRFGAKFQTPPLNSSQALVFPKLWLFAQGRKQSGTPLNWKKAVCEYAFISTQRDLLPALPATEKEIASKEVTVGPITTKTSYAGTPATGSYLAFPAGDKLVQSLFSGAGQVLR